jgi:hypothetical protein
MRAHERGSRSGETHKEESKSEEHMRMREVEWKSESDPHG